MRYQEYGREKSSACYCLIEEIVKQSRTKLKGATIGARLNYYIPMIEGNLLVIKKISKVMSNKTEVMVDAKEATDQYIAEQV